MTLILETGTGVRGANSYVLPAFVTSYLTSRNRETENTWSSRSATEQDGACIAASQYIDVRWGQRFKGSRLNFLEGREARALLTVSGQPIANETLVVSSDTFTFVAALDDFNVNEIEIGADTATTITNIITAINNAYEVEAALREDTTDQILLTAPFVGESFNNTSLNADSATNIVVTQSFQHGEDSGSQPMEFPRAGLFDRSGRSVLGVPRGLKEAAAEYAVRAVASSLLVDPTTDERGRVVQRIREKVGPLEEETEYSEGAALEQLIKPYPAADRLLDEYITAAGVIR